MKKVSLFSLVAAVALPLLSSVVLQARQPKVGQQAPSFILKDDTGTKRILSEMRGQKVALYFYPMDSSPNCTKQACSIRNGFAELEEAGVTVFGINPSSVKEHKKFKDKHNLPFALLSDAKNKIAKLYGANGWFGFPLRITFLIDETGKIVKIIKDINVAFHDIQILKGFGLDAKTK